MKFNIFVNDCTKKYNISYFDLSYVIYKILGIDKTEQMLCQEISQTDFSKVIACLEEYKNGKPLNKIFNEQNFYGLNFFVNEDVLAPRQETEILVEYVVKEIQNKPLNVLDLCTGSGCIGITVKSKCKNVNMTLADISEKAIEVAKLNAKNLNVDCKFCLSDLLNNIPEQKFDLILSNPPYIKLTDKEKLDKEVLLYDPPIALFGGEDGLEFYKKILEQSKNYLSKNGKIVFEIGYDIYKEVKTLAESYNFDVFSIKDYNKIDRVLVLKGSEKC